MSKLTAPTPIPALPLARVPQLGTDTFDEDALVFTEWEANQLAPGVNAAAQNVYDNARHASEQMADDLRAAGDARAAAQASAARAAQHAASASQASHARSWAAGQAWQVNDVVWGVTQPGVLYRCIAAHSGQSTAPEADAAHWVSIGARIALDPLAGPVRAAIERDANGRVRKITSLTDGKPQVDEFERDAQGRVLRLRTRFDGKTRVESYVRNAAGAMESMTAEVLA